MNASKGRESTRNTGKWSQPGIPHKGWTCVDIEDLEEPSSICEMCETQEIRYVHHMTHPDHDKELGAGCICAGRMEEDYEAARHRETVVRNASSRKGRWLSRKWRTSAKGNPYLKAYGYHVVVFPNTRPAGSWGFKVTNRVTQGSLSSRKPYYSEEAAKLRAFDAIIWMKEQGR